jgi:[ribosomal protein S5]-alanine N-acetyltransferase
MTAPSTAPGFLETERLRLRGFMDTESDAQLLFELDSDPEVMRYIGPFAMPTVEAYRERIRTVWLPYYTSHPTAGFWAINEKATDRFVGWVFVRPATDYKFAAEAGWFCPYEIELGYRLKRAEWGRGLATEASAALVRLAFTDPSVTAVVATALAPNRASTRVMEKVGMSRVREFTIPGFDYPAVIYAVSRDSSSLS